MASWVDRVVELVPFFSHRQARSYEALRLPEWEIWRNTHLTEAEERGHHELLNQFCLAGAMAEINRKPDEAVFLDSWIVN